MNNQNFIGAFLRLFIPFKSIFGKSLEDVDFAKQCLNIDPSPLAAAV